MCKCYNFILRRIHVYYQAVLWIRSVIDYRVWICRNKINSDRIISAICYPNTTLEMRIPPISAISLFPSPIKTTPRVLTSDARCHLLALASVGYPLVTHRKSCLYQSSSSRWELVRGWAGTRVWERWSVGAEWSWSCYLRAVSVLS